MFCQRNRETYLKFTLHLKIRTTYSTLNNVLACAYFCVFVFEGIYICVFMIVFINAQAYILDQIMFVLHPKHWKIVN